MPDGDGQGGQQLANQQQTPGNHLPAAPTPDQWLASLDQSTQVLAQSWYEAHNARQTQALKDARNERDEFAKQIKDLADKAKKGESLEADLAKLSGELDSQKGRADFYESAISEKVRPDMLKAAWHYVQAEKIFDRYNRIDWGRLKSESPGFFEIERKGTQTNAGAGQGNQGAPGNGKATDMNELIRSWAGSR